MNPLVLLWEMLRNDQNANIVQLLNSPNLTDNQPHRQLVLQATHPTGIPQESVNCGLGNAQELQNANLVQLFDYIRIL